MRVVVTGGTGFIGSHLVDRLVDENHEVIVIDNLSTSGKENINPKAKFYRRDIYLMEDYPMFEGVDVVFHTAALARVQPSIENPVKFNNTNVSGTLNLLDACVKHNVKRFVFSSSSSVYGDVSEKDLPTSENTNLNPMSPYALQKLIGEEYCKLYSKIYNLETVSLRYFNVYGDRMSLDGAYRLVIPIFAKQKLNGEPLTINGDGEQRRDFTHVDDVVEANIKCMDYPLELNGEAFNIGNGDNRSVNDIANMIGGEQTNLPPVIEPKETLACIDKAESVLNWKPNNKIENWIKTYMEELEV